MDDEILDSFHVLMLKLSIAMDLAKYLDFPSVEVVHFPHQTWFPKTRPFRSLPLDQMDAFQPIIPLPPTFQMTKF